MSQRVSLNAEKLKNCIIQHCEGNPITLKTPLVNICSFMEVSKDAKNHILNRDTKGQAAYEEFINSRLLTASVMSVNLGSN